MVTAAEAQAILGESKVIGMNLAWKADGKVFRLEATVLSEDSGEILSLRGYVGRKNRSFALLYRNTPVRKYTVHPRHRHPITRVVYTEPHKHTWDDIWEDELVYIPDDIRIGDPNIALMDFLAECNITLRGTYKSQSFFQPSQGETL